MKVPPLKLTKLIQQNYNPTKVSSKKEETKLESSQFGSSNADLETIKNTEDYNNFVKL